MHDEMRGGRASLQPASSLTADPVPVRGRMLPAEVFARILGYLEADSHSLGAVLCVRPLRQVAEQCGAWRQIALSAGPVPTDAPWRTLLGSAAAPDRAAARTLTLSAAQRSRAAEPVAIAAAAGQLLTLDRAGHVQAFRSGRPVSSAAGVLAHMPISGEVTCAAGCDAGVLVGLQTGTQRCRGAVCFAADAAALLSNAATFVPLIWGRCDLPADAWPLRIASAPGVVGVTDSKHCMRLLPTHSLGADETSAVTVRLNDRPTVGEAPPPAALSGDGGRLCHGTGTPALAIRDLHTLGTTQTIADRGEAACVYWSHENGVHALARSAQGLTLCVYDLRAGSRPTVRQQFGCALRAPKAVWSEGSTAVVMAADKLGLIDLRRPRRGHAETAFFEPPGIVVDLADRGDDALAGVTKGGQVLQWTYSALRAITGMHRRAPRPR
eukprot:TRINITY_DN6570_c0_g2_i1.p1 TRINITY_DN6570_c0_g2~~TRINITY_DN6570_c0_g2_i1.p1  ORF type:complete len:438 (+),score=122.38 TRINITY_DN6570_c0_g2_i1:55-1368(+)